MERAGLKRTGSSPISSRSPSPNRSDSPVHKVQESLDEQGLKAAQIRTHLRQPEQARQLQALQALQARQALAKIHARQALAKVHARQIVYLKAQLTNLKAEQIQDPSDEAIRQERIQVQTQELVNRLVETVKPALQLLPVPPLNVLKSFGISYKPTYFAASNNVEGDINPASDIVLGSGINNKEYYTYLSKYKVLYKSLDTENKSLLVKGILGYLINNGFVFRNKEFNIMTSEKVQSMMSNFLKEI